MNRNIPLLNFYTAMTSSLFVLPIMIPFYQNQLGLTFADFLLGEALFSLTMIVMEVPTGWLSDLTRRKYVLASGSVFWVLGLSMLGLADGLFMACAAQAVLGVAVALVSGTHSAMLYDSLQAMGRSADFKRLEGNRFAFGLYGIAGSSLLGGLLYEINPYWPMIASATVIAAGSALALWMREPPRTKSAIDRNPLHDMLVTVRYALHGHVDVARLIAAGAILFAATKLILWLQQPYQINVGMPVWSLGVAMALMFTLSGTASHFSHRLTDRFSNRAVLLALGCAGAALCGMAGLLFAPAGYAGAAFLLLAHMIFGIGYPRFQAALNSRVDSARRATVLSTANLMVHMAFIPLSLGLGWVEGTWNAGMAALGIGALLLCLGVPLFAAVKRVRE